MHVGIGEVIQKSVKGMMTKKIVAAILGFGGIAGASFAIAKFLFFVFLVIFLVFLFLGVTAARRLGGD